MTLKEIMSQGVELPATFGVEGVAGAGEYDQFGPGNELGQAMTVFPRNEYILAAG